jgi:hypothetical protein
LERCSGRIAAGLRVTCTQGDSTPSVRRSGQLTGFRCALPTPIVPSITHKLDQFSVCASNMNMVL